ncbi:hypothetical protein ABEX78_32240 [Priestia megaterium]
MMRRIKPLLQKMYKATNAKRELNKKQIERRLGIADYSLLRERSIRPPLRKGV